MHHPSAPLPECFHAGISVRVQHTCEDMKIFSSISKSATHASTKCRCTATQISTCRRHCWCYWRRRGCCWCCCRSRCCCEKSKWRRWHRHEKWRRWHRHQVTFPSRNDVRCRPCGGSSRKGTFSWAIETLWYCDRANEEAYCRECQVRCVITGD